MKAQQACEMDYIHILIMSFIHFKENIMYSIG